MWIHIAVLTQAKSIFRLIYLTQKIVRRILNISDSITMTPCFLFKIILCFYQRTVKRLAPFLLSLVLSVKPRFCLSNEAIFCLSQSCSSLCFFSGKKSFVLMTCIIFFADLSWRKWFCQIGSGERDGQGCCCLWGED